MSSFMCIGHSIDTTRSPSELEFSLLCDTDREAAERELLGVLTSFLEARLEGLDAAFQWTRATWDQQRYLDDDESQMMSTVANEIVDLILANAVCCVRCPTCGRFYIQRRLFENDYEELVPRSSAASPIERAAPRPVRAKDADDRGVVADLAESLGLARPPDDWTGLDPVLPLLERLREDGLVVLIKFDGERTAADPSGPYTFMITGPPLNGSSFRAETGSLDACLTSVLAQYARANHIA